MTTGDYALVCTKTNKLLAIFERKSLTDFGASFKDGRYENVNKLIEMRERTNCRIIFIIEGNAFPHATQTFAHVPYSAIESNIFHMMMRDNIMPLGTLNPQHTIVKLVAFMKSMVELLNKWDTTSFAPAMSVCSGDTNNSINDISTTAGSETQPQTSEHNSENFAGSNSESFSESMLTEKVTKPDIDVVRAMWAKFRGVSTVNADVFISRMSLHELFSGKYTPADISSFKTPSGKALGKNVIESVLSVLSGHNRALEEKILAGVTGISDSTAKEILEGKNLKQLLSFEPGAISIIKIGKTKRNLGLKRASDILKYFNFKIGTDTTPVIPQPIMPAPVAQPSPQPTPDKIKQVLRTL